MVWLVLVHVKLSKYDVRIPLALSKLAFSQRGVFFLAGLWNLFCFGLVFSWWLVKNLENLIGIAGTGAAAFAWGIVSKLNYLDVFFFIVNFWLFRNP